MKKCIVIGGGLAGLAAAARLADNSIDVTLLESSPKLGGRTYSFLSRNGGYIDNGQHIMMGCYRHTLDFLRTINALDEIEFQEKLKIHFVDEGGKDYYLDSSRGLYPFNLPAAIMKYKALSLAERLAVLKFFIAEIFYTGHKCENLTVEEWLAKGGQSKNTVRALWNILAISTLNTGIERGSAEMFRHILHEIFLTGKGSARIVFPKNSLSETFSFKAKEFIESRGGRIIISERVTSIEVAGKKAVKIITAKNIYDRFDFVVTAVPVNALNRIKLNPQAIKFKLPRLEHSPIVSVHLWLKENPFKERFYALTGSPVHWLFNKGTHITVITSAAGEIINYSNERITELFCLEIQKYFSYFNISEIKDSIVIKEKNATFIPDGASNLERRNVESPLENLMLAGDWTDTQIPATIEGAIKSGIEAAASVLN